MDTVIQRIHLARQRSLINEFISAARQQACHWKNIEQHLTPVYHPEANSVAWKHRDLKNQMAFLVHENVVFLRLLTKALYYYFLIGLKASDFYISFFTLRTVNICFIFLIFKLFKSTVGEFTNVYSAIPPPSWQDSNIHYSSLLAFWPSLEGGYHLCQITRHYSSPFIRLGGALCLETPHSEVFWFYTLAALYNFEGLQCLFFYQLINNGY